MIPTGLELLRLLGSICAPGKGAASKGPSAATGDFASLLDAARAGQLKSERPVEIAKDAGVQLTDDQLARVAVAADQAEAEGLSRALVIIDGKAFKLDVSMRTITGPADLATPGITAGIDGVVAIPSDADGGPQVTPMPRGIPANPSLLNLLASRAKPAA
jgi:hypothetical protein